MKWELSFAHWRYDRPSAYRGVPLNKWLVSNHVSLKKMPAPSHGWAGWWKETVFPTGGRTACHIGERNDNGQLVRVYTGVANCSVDDVYNKEVGEAIALFRVMKALATDASVIPHRDGMVNAGYFAVIKNAYRKVADVIKDADTHADIIASEIALGDVSALYSSALKKMGA